MHTNDIIDMDHLNKYVMGDDALRDEILEIFVEQINLMLSQFDVQQSDESWTLTAHTLKGAARGVGAWSIGELCEKAEALIGAAPAKTESRASMLVSLRSLCVSVVEETQRFKLAS